MAAKKHQEYGNESISALKGADRVRKRPGVIFGSDGLEGCEQAVFEILSNSIDEAREGYGTETTTQKSSAITGSWSSASCTRAESTTPTTAKATSFRWA